MLSKITSLFQKTLLKISPSTECFEITAENAWMILTLVRISNADKTRQKLAELGIAENDIQEAVTLGAS